MKRHLRLLLLQAVKQCGTYDPEEVLPRIEEELTGEETDNVTAFLWWCHTDGITFGHGNIDTVYDGFLGRQHRKARRHDALHQHARQVYDSDRDVPGEFSEE